MTSILDELQVRDGKTIAERSSQCVEDAEVELSVRVNNSQATVPSQVLYSSNIKFHTPEAGLNPLVDCAAYVFFLMGELQRRSEPHDLEQLRKELLDQIYTFQDAVQACRYTENYLSEYLPTATYAVCVTLDDIISEAPWCGDERWKEYSLVATFFDEPPSKQSFLLILERLVLDTDLYIDAMEFMFICLSFGFKCQSGSNPFGLSYEQLDRISNALYRRIHAYRGNLTKQLSPFPIKPKEVRPEVVKYHGKPVMGTAFVCTALLCAAYIGSGDYIKAFITKKFSASRQIVAMHDDVTKKQQTEVV